MNPYEQKIVETHAAVVAANIELHLTLAAQSGRVADAERLQEVSDSLKHLFD